MPSATPPACECIGNYPPNEVQQWIYCMLARINTNTGGDTGNDQFASTFLNATGNGSIPAGVLGWSVTAISGTVTVQGQALPNGGRVSGGGYGGKTTSAAIPYTVAAGVALVSYDAPA